MANRVLRDTTDSETINKLTPNAEVFFYRLFMKADDFGSFHANPKLLKSALYPLKDGVTDSEMYKLLDELLSVKLIFLYNVNGKQYLRILNFGQRLRSMRSKYPCPSEKDELAANCGESRPETRNKKQETESEIETKPNIEFDLFWNLYDKKVGDKAKLLKKWIALKDEDRSAIMEHVPKYKLAQPDKKYRKDPQTYFNNKSWNDEIIYKNDTTSRTNNGAKGDFGDL